MLGCHICEVSPSMALRADAGTGILCEGSCIWFTAVGDTSLGDAITVAPLGEGALRATSGGTVTGVWGTISDGEADTRHPPRGNGALLVYTLRPGRLLATTGCG